MSRKISGAFIAIFTCLLSWSLPAGVYAADTKVNFCASWIIYGAYTPYVAGIERGIFKAEGLDVTLHRGHGSGDTFKKVAVGSCDYGDAAAGAAGLGRVSGVKAKEIYMTAASLQDANYYFEDVRIKTPKDFEGKRITGGPKASSNTLMWPIFARANGIDTGKVEVVYMSPAAKFQSLLAGKVDMIIAFHDNVFAYQTAAQGKGKKLAVQLWADHGIDIYGNGLTASDETIAGKKDATMRFLRGYVGSLQWAYQNREAAVDIFVKKHPEHKRESALKSMEVLFYHMFDKYTDKFGLGHMNPDKAARTVNMTLEGSGLQTKLDPSEAFTNEFVKRLPEDRRFFFRR